MSLKKERTALDEESMRFLRRGEPSPAPRPTDLAVGPSVIFDEESGRAVAVEPSPPPSQLVSTQQQAFEALSSSAARLPRQRPRFHTVQDLDLALNQAIEGKITSKNAWVSKEASDLLEGITHTIQNTLDVSATADDYAGFAKAATVVEGCSKVWTSRVDSTHQQSNLMVQRLLRNDESDRGAGGAAGLDGTGEGDGTEANGGAGRRRKGPHGRGGAAAARTLALDASEINLDSKAKTALTQGGMNAQFRAITEKFDQGNAQGLLMNNAPQGMRGNLILDIDYARTEAEGGAFSGRQPPRQGAKGSRTSRGESTLVKAEPDPRRSGESARADEEMGSHRDGRGRMSLALRQLVEEDAFMDVAADQLALPRYEPRALTASALLSARNSVRLSRGDAGLGGERAAGGRASTKLNAEANAANAVESLLMVPHANSPIAAEAETAAATTGAAGTGATDPAVQQLYPHANDDDDDGGDWGEDFGGGFDDDDDGTAAPGGADGRTAETSLAAELVMSGADLGAAARDLVSGVASMEAMDRLLGSTGAVQQLALEADDPSSWCPLSQVTPASAPHAALTGGLAPNAELSKLRKEHRFGMSNDHGTPNTTASTAGLLKHAPETAAKSAGKKQKSVVFDLPPEVLQASELAGRGGGVFVLDKHEVNQSALKQSQTATKNVTPLGRELVLGKDAERAVLAYVQSGYQRTKAEQMGLLLPEVPQPGMTMPSYLPYPVQVSDFFQPFSTSQPEWNMLRKSATGQVLDLRTGAAVGAPGVSGRGSGGSHNTLHRHTMGDAADDGVDARFDMPVEFFPGGAEHDDDDGGYDAFGPDDDDGMYNAEAQAADEALRAERLLLSQFNAEQARAMDGGLASGRPSSSDASGARPSFQGDLSQLAKVLHAPEATIPNQVDVVQLRITMWEALQQQMASNPLIPSRALAPDPAGRAARDAVSDEEDKDASHRPRGLHMTPRDPNAPLLKKHAQRVLGGGQRTKRGRDDAASDDEEAEEEDGEERREAASPHAKRRAVGDDREAQSGSPRPAQRYELGLARTSGSDDSAEEEEEKAFDGRQRRGAAAKKDGLPHFSEVVRRVLPAVPSISSTGTLSPAFFFFSILFLANEHNVVIDNVDSLDDLVVRGIAHGVAAGGH